MKHIYFTILLLFLSFPILWAQHTEITGNVQSKGLHIPYANVLIKGTQIGTTTDAKGHFTISNAPEGMLTVRVQCLGYKATEKTIPTTPGQAVELNIELEVDHINLEEVVVSADRNEGKRSETPVIINVVSRRLMENVCAMNAAEGLNFQPGLRVENNCQNCGLTQLRMNGMEGAYSQILINSRPIFSALNGVYGLEQIPSNMIQRIEVVRGGGSALFGGNAIAGTVNIITKEPVTDSYQIGMNYSLIDGQEPDYVINFNNSTVTDNLKNGLFVFGMYRNRSPFDANADGFTEITRLRNFSGGFRAFHKPGSRTKFVVDFHGISEFRRGGNRLDGLPHESDITEQVTHDIAGGGITFDALSKDSKSSYSVYLSGQHTNRDSYYGANQSLSGYGNTRELSLIGGVQYSRELKHFIIAPAKIVGGAENQYSNLQDKKLGYYDMESGVRFPSQTIVNQILNTPGTYLQSEWDFGRLRLLAGFRYDLPDRALEVSPVFVPRANLLINLSTPMQLRLSYAKGYRAPQVFDEDLHVEASAARIHVHRVSKNLRVETSHSISGSIDYTRSYGQTQTYFLIEGFYTKLNDPFSKEFYIHEEDKLLEVRKVNAPDGAWVKGVNLEGKAAFSSNVSLQLGATIQQSEFVAPQAWGENEASTSKSFTRTPEHYGYAVLVWETAKKLKISLTGNYTGPMLVPHLAGGLAPDGKEISRETLETTRSFFEAGLRMAYNFRLNSETGLELSGGVQNIFNSYQSDFDRGMFRDAGYIYGPNRPRTLFIGLKMSNIL